MPDHTHLTGGAGAAFSPLQPAYGPGGTFAHGPFTAELSPTILTRASGMYPMTLSIGLLRTRPDPDGCQGQELEHPSYQRQSVDLADRSATHLCIERPVLFEIFNCPRVVALALFDQEDRVVAQGALRGRVISAEAPGRFEFSSCSILIRKPYRAGRPEITSALDGQRRASTNKPFNP
jgi:hypothetical protein